MKRFLFPFFKKERHEFLTQKWWFRLIIVFYLVVLLISPFYIWFSYVNGASGWCYASLDFFQGDAWNTQLQECSQFARDAYLPGAGFALIGTVLWHYLVQLIFFKLVIDYVVMGGKKARPQIEL